MCTQQGGQKAFLHTTLSPTQRIQARLKLNGLLFVRVKVISLSLL